ncbi:MAG: hypothetical protein JO372_19385 [Solirubrobacterales bacterium]|nr:hypothetical protein [Solirubrobacterales bacterium]
MQVLRFARLLIVLALVLAVPVAAANASSTQEASFQDNRLLLFDPPLLDQTLQTLRQLGVERLRISVVWDRIAPDPNLRTPPPGFDASDPADYPAAGWLPYDTIVTQAARYGMRVNFDLIGGAPLWATGGRAPAPNMAHVWYPSPSAYGAFATAVGRRYSGAYTPPGASASLPRVSFWSIWNEPNVGTSSLSPQTVHGVEVAPQLYRSIANAAFEALLSTGHRPGEDTILVGELASTGHLDPGSGLGMQPLRFLRALYCLDSSYRQLRGAPAAARGCPTTAAASSQFRAANPALFDATGWSHHPYDLLMAPNVPAPPAEPDWVTFADLGKLERALDRAQRVYGSDKKFPIYLTEFGYETNPPRPDFSTTPALQAQYIDEGEYMAWRDPRVRTLTEYLLQDAPPGGGSSVSAFASGLLFANGAPKPAFDAYRLPLWMPSVKARHGDSLEVWGCVRPAKHYPRQQIGPVQIQLAERTVRSIAITNPQGYFDVHISFPHSGSVRLAWRYPGGPIIYSREIAITEASGGQSPAVLIAVIAAVVLLGCLALARQLGRRRQQSAAS